MNTPIFRAFTCAHTNTSQESKSYYRGDLIQHIWSIFKLHFVQFSGDDLHFSYEMPPDDCFHRLKNLSVNLSCYTLLPIQYCLCHSPSVNNNTLSQLLMARLLPNTFQLNKSEKKQEQRKKSQAGQQKKGRQV